MGILSRLLATPLLGVIHLYRLTLSPLVGKQCRFTPTCSTYGLEAIHTHGPFRGSWLTFTRICRCNPFSKGGFDPVPLPSDVSRSPGAEKENLKDGKPADAPLE